MDKITLSDSFFSLDYLRYVVTKSDEGESVILIYFQFEIEFSYHVTILK